MRPSGGNPHLGPAKESVFRRVFECRIDLLAAVC